jgi:hypothetical protein
MKKPLNWIPLWIDPWLFGSTRIELSLEQRAVWIDLLTLAGKDSGFIRANEGVPYPLEQLAGLLRIPQDVLEATIGRCIEVTKLERLQDGTLRVASWDRYKLTPQYRRRLNPPSQTLPSSEKEEKRRGEESKGEGNTGSPHGNTGSKKGNTEPQTGKEEGQDDLPPIPKGIPFEIQDQLRRLRADIRKTERVFRDPNRDKSKYSHGDAYLKGRFDKARTEYLNLVEDYK